LTEADPTAGWTLAASDARIRRKHPPELALLDDRAGAPEPDNATIGDW
jgi:hypothetical protein